MVGPVVRLNFRDNWQNQVLSHVIDATVTLDDRALSQCKDVDLKMFRF